MSRGVRPWWPPQNASGLGSRNHPPMPGRPWTKKEDRLVRSLFGKMPMAQIAMRVGRPFPATKLRAHKTLGLRLGGPRVLWSDAQDELLTRCLAVGSVCEVAAALGRTEFAVCARARVLGLKRCRVRVGTEKVSARHKLLKRFVDEPTWGRGWRSVHTLVWEAAHGPLPPDHLVCFKPGMRVLEASQITLERIELLSRDEQMKRNTIRRYPPDLVKVMNLNARLKRTIKSRTRNPK